jgi:hypothetical protein
MDISLGIRWSEWWFGVYKQRRILFTYYDRLCHFMLDSMLAGDGALLGETFP